MDADGDGTVSKADLKLRLAKAQWGRVGRCVEFRAYLREKQALLGAERYGPWPASETGINCSHGPIMNLL